MINEEIKKEIRDVIDNPTIPSSTKHAAMAKLLKKMLHSGMETGLVDTKPKKGSSRAVYFPSEPEDITLDDTPTKMHSVLKIAFPGQLDKYSNSDMLLGEHQTLHEGDQYIQNNYSVLRHIGENKFHYNENGLLAPVLHTHEDGHYLHMGRISPIKSGEFNELTKNEDFPKGISHNEFQKAVQHEYDAANGNTPYVNFSEEKLKKLKEHPFVHNTIMFVLDTQTHPADFAKRNMGVWEHPITGKKHIVLADYGANSDVLKLYAKAYANMFNKKINMGIW